MRMRPLAINTLAVMLLIALFITLLKLGFWQLDRANNKEVTNALRTKRLHTTSLALPKIAQLNGLNGQQITLQGQLDFSKSMLLDNRVVNGVVGFEVLVPLHMKNQNRVLINLGWIAAGPKRSILPALTMWKNIEEVSGYLHRPSLNPFVNSLINASDKKQYPIVIPAVDFEEIKTALDQDYYPSVIRLHEDSDWGYYKAWRWSNKMTAHKHRGYAIQWFALALTLLLLSSYFIWRLNQNDNQTNRLQGIEE